MPKNIVFIAVLFLLAVIMLPASIALSSGNDQGLFQTAGWLVVIIAPITLVISALLLGLWLGKQSRQDSTGSSEALVAMAEDSQTADSEFTRVHIGGPIDILKKGSGPVPDVVCKVGKGD